MWRHEVGNHAVSCWKWGYIVCGERVLNYVLCFWSRSKEGKLDLWDKMEEQGQEGDVQAGLLSAFLQKREQTEHVWSCMAKVMAV